MNYADFRRNGRSKPMLMRLCARMRVMWWDAVAKRWGKNVDFALRRMSRAMTDLKDRRKPPP